MSDPILQAVQSGDLRAVPGLCVGRDPAELEPLALRLFAEHEGWVTTIKSFVEYDREGKLRAQAAASLLAAVGPRDKVLEVLGERHQHYVESAEIVVRQRRPAWTPDVVAVLLGLPRGHLRVDAWVREGLIPLPTDGGFVQHLAAQLEGGAAVRARLLDGATPLGDLLAPLSGGWPESTPPGALDDHPSSWPRILRALVDAGVLDRAALVGDLLDDLARIDHPQARRHHAGMLAVLAAPAELRPHLDRLWALLQAPHEATVTWAFGTLDTLDQAEPLPAAPWTRALLRVVAQRAKGAPTKALKSAGRRATTDPGLAAEVALAALEHTDPGVQEAAARMLVGLAGAGDDVRARVVAAAPGLAAPARQLLAGWLEAPAAPPAPATTWAGPEPVVPLASVRELVAAWFTALAGTADLADPADIERLVDGSLRFAADRATVDLASLAARAGAITVYDYERCVRHPTPLARLALQFVVGGATEPFRGSPFWWRLDRAMGLLDRAAGLPLLSLPTDRDGWITPDVALTRVRAWVDAGVEPDEADVTAMLLRLHWDDREAALAAAVASADELGAALAFALDGPAPSVVVRAPWLAAAARARADAPVVEMGAPWAGAGHPASWTVRSEFAPGLIQTTPQHFHHPDGRQLLCFDLAVPFAAPAAPHVRPDVPVDFPAACLHVMKRPESPYVPDSSPFGLRAALQTWPHDVRSAFAVSLRGLLSDVLSTPPWSDPSPVFARCEDPRVELGAPGHWALGLGLLSTGAAGRAAAAGALVATCAHGVLDPEQLAAVWAEVGPHAPMRRAADVWVERAASPGVAATGCRTFAALIRRLPGLVLKDLGQVLTAWDTLAAEAGVGVADPGARAALEGVASQGSGKAKASAKRLLGR